MARGDGEATTLGSVALRTKPVRPSSRRPKRGGPPLDPSCHDVSYTLITSKKDLTRAMRRLQKARSIGLDIETASNSGFGFKNGAVRLIQLGVDEPGWREQFIIDCFEVDPAPVMELMEDPSIEKVVHHALFEQPWLKHSFNTKINNLFDTKIAWDVINRQRASNDPDYDKHSSRLATIVEKLTGEGLAKEQQGSNWGAARLTEEQLIYAARDVSVLCPIAEETKRIARELGVLAEIEERSSGVYASSVKQVRNRGGRNGDDYRRVSNLIQHARSLAELERYFAASRQTTLSSRNRRAIQKIYADRQAELRSARSSRASGNIDKLS